ncbi:YHYH protein [Epibacterium ulvae]|uniref:YHYH protein n=1 Tax=Epibacterium ulvae TaxID=1156985 RepID=UPI001BFC25B6|nr:YHYH protein [Epibacterium ulvae]MBT8155700.1 YHYH protein [Epibacterium ulvae]
MCFTMTAMLIPIDPVTAAEPTSLGTVAKVGLALDGVPIFADAPSVLEIGHMPALNTCGGHVDPGGWYHWHATATDINSVFASEGVDASCANVVQDATAQFAYAFDGFAIYGSLEADGSIPIGLDACGGHIGPVPGQTGGVYHYHANDSFPNLPKCLVGVVALNNLTTTAEQGIGSPRAQGGLNGPCPDFAAIAEKLGVEPTAP